MSNAYWVFALFPFRCRQFRQLRVPPTAGRFAGRVLESCLCDASLVCRNDCLDAPGLVGLEVGIERVRPVHPGAAADLYDLDGDLALLLNGDGLSTGELLGVTALHVRASSRPVLRHTVAPP